MEIDKSDIQIIAMTYNPFTLAGKTVLVTGASSGIGRATAVECSRMGAHLCITGRDAGRLDETYQALEGEGHIQLTADLTDEGQIVDMVARLPMLDGVVHSAGVTHFMLAKHIDKGDIKEIMDINVGSILLLNRELLSAKRINRGASFVFISSLMTRINHIGYTLYSASKGAVVSIAGALARELADMKCRSNVVSPGMVKTPLFDDSLDETLKKDEMLYPLGYGKPEDVAWACVYLLSDAARWVTRSEFFIHGGCV